VPHSVGTGAAANTRRPFDLMLPSYADPTPIYKLWIVYDNYEHAASSGRDLRG